MDIASTIDHTLLRPEATMNEIDTLCTEAQQFQFHSVCVHPYWVMRCVSQLKDTSVKVCSVIGFPFGCNTASTKAFETAGALAAGAKEFDMVINLGALKSEAWNVVEGDIASVVDAAEGHVEKVILETSLLTEAEKIRACQAAETAGAHFVKTSTGFNTGGATLDDISLMRTAVGDRLQVKASGGIRDLAALQSFLAAGATRIGTSHGAKILRGQSGAGAY
jgi:deoxyribose-phosphate aldolase